MSAIHVFLAVVGVVVTVRLVVDSYVTDGSWDVASTLEALSVSTCTCEGFSLPQTEGLKDLQARITILQTCRPFVNKLRVPPPFRDFVIKDPVADPGP